MNLRIGHSPDPDDAFLFYAMTQGKVSHPQFAIQHVMEGIEQLNQRALEKQLEMTAISVHAYAYCAEHYILLPTGASVGDGYGPVLVARRNIPLEEVKKLTVAVPGRLTTASLLLQLAVGRFSPKILPFDQILSAVESDEVDAGLLIHEGQLTYGTHGLVKLLDLGEWWKQKTGLPVPLGVNVLRRDLGPRALREVAQLFQQSLDYAFAHRQEALAYAQQFSRGLDPVLTDQFVGMYVNDLSLECRPWGAAAMQRLLDEAAEAGIAPRCMPLEFVEP